VPGRPAVADRRSTRQPRGRAEGRRDVADDELLIDPGPITRLTLNRPEKHNVLSEGLGDRVVAALQAAALDTRGRL